MLAPLRYLLLLLAVCNAVGAAAVTRNGFNLDDALIPAEEILSGGPPRDGIPAIDEPRFVSAVEVDFLAPQERVLGIRRNGVSKAYPINILNWHEVVNDDFAGEAIVVTFCPLCGTGMSFQAEVAGERRDFGVSGLLYKSDVLLYDRASESLWSQLDRRAVSGPLRGERLTMVATAHTSWADWSARHPDTLVLSTDTGHWRDYSRNPYLGYESSERTIFPAGPADKRYHPKELVMGLELDGAFKAYPFVELARVGESRLNDKFAGQPLTLEHSAEHRSGRVLNAAGEEIPTVLAFWFAWKAFHPDTEVFTAP